MQKALHDAELYACRMALKMPLRYWCPLPHVQDKAAIHQQDISLSPMYRYQGKRAVCVIRASLRLRTESWKLEEDYSYSCLMFSVPGTDTTAAKNYRFISFQT